MYYGRVPVIISDDWQPPPGISWREFSLVIPENNVSAIPNIIKQLEGEAIVMGQLAQRVFDENYSLSVFLDRLLMTLVSKYYMHSFTSEATWWRAWQTCGWREIRTVCHQAQSRAAGCFSKN
jgi:hypothetical protein